MVDGKMILGLRWFLSIHIICSMELGKP